MFSFSFSILDKKLLVDSVPTKYLKEIFGNYQSLLIAFWGGLYNLLHNSARHHNKDTSINYIFCNFNLGKNLDRRVQLLLYVWIKEGKKRHVRNNLDTQAETIEGKSDLLSVFN